MNTSTVIIAVNSFSLLFNVDVAESRDFSSRLTPPGASDDHGFVRADLFVVADGARVPVLSRDQLGNAVKFLALMAQRLHIPDSSKLPKELVQAGGLGKWLDDYFVRQSTDDSVMLDERSYALINDKALAADNNGLVGIYSVDGATIVEVWVHDKTSDVQRVWWHACDPAILCAEIERAIEECRMAVAMPSRNAWH